MPTIDIHSHIFSSDRPLPPAALRDPMWDVSDRIGAGFRARAEAQALPRIEAYLDNMAAWGVDIVCVNNVALTAEGARAMNDFNAEIIAANPGRMIGFAAVPMDAGEAGARELEYAVKELGFYGAKIYPKIHGVALDAPSARPLYEAASDLDVPILTHTTGMPQMYSGVRGLDWMDHTLDNPARMIDSGLMRDISNLKFIFAHQAGGFVYYIESLLERNPELAPVFQRFYVDIVPAVRFSENQVRAAIDVLGVDHVMWGIDYPWVDMDSCAKCFPHFNAMNFTPEVKTAVLGGNAQKLLKLAL
jgi:predicted TIM-barrel fold metal-dependent hydrolase